MSNSFNETSVPNQRGRKSILKTKRRTSKKIRSMPIESDFKILRMIKHSVSIDK